MLNNFISFNKVIRTGVLQGSILGTILFIIFLNDFSYVCPESNIQLYTDDTTMSFYNDNYHNLVQNVNSELNNMCNWLQNNMLCLNVDKSSWMLFTGRRIQVGDADINLNGDPLTRSHTIKSLGIIFDTNLSFLPHIQYILDKISKNIGIFYKLRSILPFCVLRNLYYTLVYPYLLYSILVWGGTYPTHLSRLLLMQKKVVRIITKSHFLAHSNPLFYRTSILKIHDLYKFHVALYGFRNKDSLPYVSHGYRTRFSHQPIPSFNRLNITQRSLSQVAPSIFNELPAYIKNSSSDSVFKLEYRKFLLSNYLWIICLKFN